MGTPHLEKSQGGVFSFKIRPPLPQIWLNLAKFNRNTFVSSSMDFASVSLYLTALNLGGQLDPRVQGYAAHVALIAPASLDPRSCGHAAHVALFAPACLDPRSFGHAAHVALIAPASLDPRSCGHAAHVAVIEPA